MGGSHANASYCGAEVVRKVEYCILIPSLVRNGRHLRHLEKQQCQSHEQVLEANGDRNDAQRVIDSFQEPERDQKQTAIDIERIIPGGLASTRGENETPNGNFQNIKRS